MQGGLRRGLNIDEDEEAKKPDQYGGIDANRKRGNFERNLDDMLFGGGGMPARRKPTAQKKQQVSTSKDAVKPEIKPEATISKPPEPAKVTLSTNEQIPSIKKPEVNNYIDPKNEIKPPTKPFQNPQPLQQFEEVTIEVLHPFSNRNKYNKPGLLRKGKKVAQDYNFSEENTAQNSAVDVVRPLQTDSQRQKRLNEFDFHDYEFPASWIALGVAHKDRVSIWKKPQQIAKVINFGKFIDPNDLQHGTLSSPHFLSALSGIAQVQANTKRLIEDQKTNRNGFYLVRLFINSVWRYVPVDSTLPFVNGENAGVMGNVEGGELDLHFSLIEKAYAKSFGSYEVFSKIHPRQNYLRDLTGSPIKKYSLDTPDIQNIVKKALTSGQVVQAVPTVRIATLGINPNYSYSVINYSAKGSLELRNSWGTIEQKSKTSVRSEGNFELASGMLRDNISHLLITQLNTAYFTTTVQAKHRLGFYSTFSFKVRDPTHGFLTVSQWDDRLFPASSNYSYSPASIILQKNGETVEFISANHTAGIRNLDLQVQLDPGDYTVFVAINWKNQEHNLNLTFYGSQKVDFSRVYNQKNPNLIAQSLEALNLANGKRVDTSKTTSQYTTYHPQSNLILITLQNTSSREGRANIDLSKAKLENLTLISGHNNEENYREKVLQEIDKYKQSTLNDRKWGVNLQSGGKFTWVLASKQPYNEENAKAWGFI